MTEEHLPTLTTGEAARVLQVSRDTVKRLYERGEIEGFKTSQIGHIRLYRDAVEEYARQRRSRPSPDKS